MMSDYLRPIDREGAKIAAGDKVVLVVATDHLLKNLPSEDQEAIKAQVGKVLTVVGFDDYGFAELEFEYAASDGVITFHTIWVEPSCLKSISRS